ncbi:MAG: pentapeptide repeat-containing protein [Oscillospiraceae bacterium]|nr:pentapeptide repeat-containing protein [Oscillospiraceae bacterium]
MGIRRFLPVNFRNADLIVADFTGANLIGADINDAVA